MRPSEHRAVVIWLVVECLVILALVAVGGITRLTESGLSMVDWRPFMGVIPPLSADAWQATFDAYRAYPEYLQLRPEMTLDEFKSIFFWEYLHRLLARATGLVFLVPYLYFVIRGAVRGALAGRLGIAFILGGMQGVLGWYMVKSGLVDLPHVSHFRLAAHLGLAFFIFGYIFWIILDLLPESRGLATDSRDPRSLRPWAVGFLVVLVLQVIYGAFVAGLNAGYMFNTFPLMLDRWIPPGLFYMETFTKNLLSNPIMVQFLHRGLAWVLAGWVVLLWWKSRNLGLTRRQGSSIQVLLVVTGLQFLLGVLTLLLGVPVALGVAHQVNALFLLAGTLLVVHSLGVGPKKYALM